MSTIGASYNPWAGQGTYLDYAADQTSDPNRSGLGNWWNRNGEGVAQAATMVPGIFCTIFPKKCEAQIRADQIGVGDNSGGGGGTNQFLVIGLAAVIVILLLAIILKK